jgi:hypothetical protein
MPPRYMDMLVGGTEGGAALTALATIHEAGSASHDHDDTPIVPVGSPSTDDDAASEEVDGAAQLTPQGRRGCELAFRVSSAERIRRKSELLYSEIHTMMERHDARTGREREVQRRASRGSRVGEVDVSYNTALRRGDGGPQKALTVPSQTPLPDLHQMFEKSRRAHLTEAQQQRTYFPSSSKPTTYSSKDPGTFSYRFQALEPPPSWR